MKISNRMVMGSALSLAAFLVAVDHTRSPIPAAQTASENSASIADNQNNPCSLQATPAPCSLDQIRNEKKNKDNPCALESSSHKNL